MRRFRLCATNNTSYEIALEVKDGARRATLGHHLDYHQIEKPFPGGLSPSGKLRGDIGAEYSRVMKWVEENVSLVGQCMRYLSRF